MKLYKLEKLLQIEEDQVWLGPSLILMVDSRKIIYISKQANIYGLMGELYHHEHTRRTYGFEVLDPIILSVPRKYREIGYRFVWCKDCHCDGSNIEGIIIS